MKRYFLLLILCICSSGHFYAQEDDGVVAFDLPTRNSLTFNRFTINPTFSFVREQTKYISFYNKREWVQFENAPLTYLASYSGRFGENIGAGIGLFQQNYGVLTTFGGILNFAYNAQLGYDSNLTFGLNIGAYKSGVNTANVITNFQDPSLQNIPDNFLLTVNPGINYGTEFLDFGLAVKNLALYNVKTSTLIEENPKQSLQAHMLYTGYIRSRDFFDRSKFTGLIQSEFQEEETILSGVAMVTVPKGIWAQVGYNTLYGVSGGLGLHITDHIALEYNYETAFGDLNQFGPSHEITLAYRFKNNKYYDYSREDEISSILSSGNKRRYKKTRKSKVARTTSSKKKAHETKETVSKIESEKESTETVVVAQNTKDDKTDEQEAQAAAEAEAKRLAEQQAQAAAEAEAKRLAEEQAQAAAEAEAKRLAEQQAQAVAEAEAKRLAEEQAQAAAEAEAKRLAEQQAQAVAEAEAKRLAEEQAQAAAEAEAKRLAEEQAQAAAESEAQRLEEEQAQAAVEAEAQTVVNEGVEIPEVDTVQATDQLGMQMQELAEITTDAEAVQNDLLAQLSAIIDIKDQDLKDLKKENDLSDQGITVAPKAFKSVTAENNKLKAVKFDLDKVIAERQENIDALTKLYDTRSENSEFAMDEVNLFYKKEIKRLKSEQLKANNLLAQLDVKLEAIKVATEFEKRRRIKRAAYSSEKDRYSQDRAMLKSIRETTSLSETPLKEEDFDFGELQGNSIKILKNIENIESGYYLIIAVHSDTDRRNKFLKNVVASGRTDVDFFHDVNTSKYYIFYEKFEDIGSATNALSAKGNRPYNGKMSIVKIEN
ncbi:PorP/SprF family type IX secretion system membrane protein [Winogradskyella arenosi]|uniref:Type IX secretion system PorP/SprF family membrane protein n=1 Tax=Winogradskyella arenosi TaxID=533325 RepID=A0A368ZC63_9FLAO|nr:type IX secretion system membrane protein PorP/SprF [Winogradskyella arenosi]RCW90634.1 type IX secretion system PorP/SprF family membrane protein [Winogradskyella arenosi]